MSNSATTRSTAGPGFAFEDLVAADMLSRFLTDMPIPGGTAPGIKLLSQVRGLGWAIDDLMVEGEGSTGQRVRLGISCKSNAQVSINGLPGDFASDAWALWRDQDKFDQANDRVALVVRGHHPAFFPLWHDIKSWSNGDPALALGRIEATAKHRRVFDSLQQPGVLGGTAPSREETLRLIRAIDILPYDFQLSPSEALGTAVQRCRGALVSNAQTEAEKLWEALVARSEMARTGNGTIVLTELITELSAAFDLKAHPSIAASWSRLIAFSADHLVGIETQLPNGHQIERKEEAEVAKHLAERRGCLVVGDSGVGKSATVRKVLDHHFPAAAQLWLDPQIAAACLSSADRAGLGITHDLITIFERCPGHEHVVVFDSAERIPEIGLRQLNAFLASLQALQHPEMPKWRVVVVTQGDALEERVRAQPGIAALPAVSLSELTDGAVKMALLSVPQLRWAANDHQLRSAVSNVRTLSWVVASAPTFTAAEDLASVPAIADRLWVRWTGGKLQLQGLMMRLAARDAAFERSFPASQLDPADAAAFDARPGETPLRVSARNHVEFEHDLASDWARYQRLKELGPDIDRWGAFASQPLWIGALRLFGQHLLRLGGNGRNGWDVAFEKASEQGNLSACDILLDALCLDHGFADHLAHRADLLFADEGKLLLRLMSRFLYLATTPVRWDDPTLSSGMRMYLEADMRRPIAGRWAPMARFLDGHLKRVTDLGSPIVSRICELWLSGTPPLLDGRPWPLRSTFARVALANGRTVQIQAIGHGWRRLGADGDVPVFKTALAAAPDLPADVATFALEMARRRPLSPEFRKRSDAIREERRAADAERERSRASVRVPEDVFSFRRRLPPWPLGGTGEINQAFRKAVVHNAALVPLMQTDAAAARETLLACLINDHPMEESGSMSWTDDIGMASDNSSDPTMFWKSPFFTYFQCDEDNGFDALHQLLAFATERWDALGKKAGSRVIIKVPLGGRHKAIFTGPFEHFRWAQDSSYTHGQLNCAVDALERWLVMQIEKGIDVSDRCSALLQKGGSTAILGALVNVGKYRPELFKTVLAPLLEIEILYWWDDKRVEYQGMGFDQFNWLMQGEQMFEAAREWWFAPHRGLQLRFVARSAIANDTDLAKRIAKASSKWPKPRDKVGRLNQRALQAELDAKNYRRVDDPETGQPSVMVELPADLVAAIEEHRRSAATDMRPVTLPLQCEQILAKADELGDADAAYLAGLLPAPTAELPPEADGRRMVAAAAATLAARAGAWLDENPDAKAKVHQLLRRMAEGLEATHESRRRRGMVDDPALNFVAVGVIHAAVASDDRASWDAALLTLLACGDGRAVASLLRNAAELRDQLGDAWFRLNELLVLGCALSRLSPRFEQQEELAPTWDRWLARFRSFRVFGLSRDIAAVDPAGIARRAERLLERRRARWWPERPPRHKGKARRFAGLLSHTLKNGFDWLLDTDNPPSIMGDANNRALVERLLEFELWRLLGDDRDDVTEEDVFEDNDGEYDLPSDLGYAILSVLPRLILAGPAERGREIWEPVLAVGPLGHVFVDRFISSWFMLLYKQPDAERFVAEWKAMLGYAFGEDWRTGRKWFRGSEMLVNLLGLNSFNNLENAPEVCQRLPDIKPFYERWAANELRKDEESIVAFAYFLTTVPGRFLQLEGIVWIADALRDTDRFYRDAGNKVAELLDAILTTQASALVSEHKARNAMIDLAALLVRLQISTGLGLQARIAAIK